MNANERMYNRIKQHGNNLKVIFPLATDDPAELCKRLRRIEVKLNRLATDFCNGDIDGDAWDIEKDKAIKSLDKILHFTQSNVPVKINSDPRGYALKIRDEYVREHNLNIYRDWGGYGILAPEFDGKA